METRPEISVRMLPRETGLAITRVFGSSRGLADPPAEMLPPEACVGFLDGAESLVVWPIRLQGTKTAMLEWMITSPGLGMRDARRLIRHVLAELESRLQSDGVELLFAGTPHEAIAREAVNIGWTADPSQSTHLSKRCCR